MNEEKSKTTKILIFAILSLLCGIVGIIVILLRIFFYRPWWSEYVGRNVSFLAGIAGLILGFAILRTIDRQRATRTFFIILFILALQPLLYFLPYPILQLLSMFISMVVLLVIFVMPIIPKSYFSMKNEFISGTFANSSIVISTLLIIFWWIETCMPAATSLRMGCGGNLARIGKTIKIYSKEHHGQYPDPNQWCNILLQYDKIKKTDFLCTEIKYRWKRQVFPLPIPKYYECYYAMNPNCEPNSPIDTVLLFETKGGWNKYGGPELLTTDNHRNEGCNILFKGGYVDFISTRNIADLKWNP
jgi:hypothetical protein